MHLCPHLLTSLMNMSLVLRLPRKMHLCRSSSNVPRLPSFLEMLQYPHVLFTFDKVHNPLRLPRKTTLQRPKVARTCGGALYILTSKRPSRHSSVHFFDISTSKSAWGVFRLFSLANVLRATTACKFSSFIWPAGSAPAAFASLLFGPPEPQIIENIVFCDFPTFSRTWIFFLRRFSLFDLLSSSLLFSSLTLPISAFHLSILSSSNQIF